MTAAARLAPVELLPTARQHLFDAFDAVRRVPSDYIVNENAMPGATAALRAWPGLDACEVIERVEYGSPQLVARLRNGSTITVTNAVAKEHHQ